MHTLSMTRHVSSCIGWSRFITRALVCMHPAGRPLPQRSEFRLYRTVYSKRLGDAYTARYDPEKGPREEGSQMRKNSLHALRDGVEFQELSLGTENSFRNELHTRVFYNILCQV